MQLQHPADLVQAALAGHPGGELTDDELAMVVMRKRSTIDSDPQRIDEVCFTPVVTVDGIKAQLARVVLCLSQLPVPVTFSSMERFDESFGGPVASLVTINEDLSQSFGSVEVVSPSSKELSPMATMGSGGADAEISLEEDQEGAAADEDDPLGMTMRLPRGKTFLAMAQQAADEEEREREKEKREREREEREREEREREAHESEGSERDGEELGDGYTAIDVAELCMELLDKRLPIMVERVIARLWRRGPSALGGSGQTTTSGSADRQPSRATSSPQRKDRGVDGLLEELAELGVGDFAEMLCEEGWSRKYAHTRAITVGKPHHICLPLSHSLSPTHFAPPLPCWRIASR